ncbi:hypothetical protein RB653_006139 [Dictyostelium firmibasis]|uniref:Uncharacterized protein n=1 Tax=Dictyostelium firmibasis TaxID=79012 RepID=A0AAN7Z1S0_9MYCE
MSQKISFYHSPTSSGSSRSFIIKPPTTVKQTIHETPILSKSFIK